MSKFQIASFTLIMLLSITSIYMLTRNANLWPSTPSSSKTPDPSTTATQPKEDITKIFEHFKRTYRKRYAGGPESDFRLQIFSENYNYINTFNANSTSTTESSALQIEVNEFADLTLAEFKELYFGHDSSLDESKDTKKNNPKRLRQHFELTEALPDSVDWREKLATPIQKQGTCGSCWAFSTIVALEGAYAKKTGNVVKFSEQNLMDCCRIENSGCNGGDPAPALDCVMNILKGIMKETDYPYQAINRKQCDHDEAKNAFSPDGYDNIPANNELAMKEAVSKQPISICIAATTKNFQFYKTGIADNVSLGCDPQFTDHCVGIVGYGSESGKNYWIVKNSWGEAWGEKGYIRMLRSDSSNSPGTCGIASEPRIVNWSSDKPKLQSA